MTRISSHVLDTAAGRPAAGVPISLQTRTADGSWTEVGSATSDEDGRVTDLGGEEGVSPGVHRLLFATGAYLEPDAFFPEVAVTFRVGDEDHLHVPLLLSPHGYTTYRGS